MEAWTGGGGALLGVGGVALELLERERAEDDRTTVVDVLVGGAQEGRLHRGGVHAPESRPR